MVTVLTVLKSGGEYKPEHVYRLGDQVLKYNPHVNFTCMSDVELDCSWLELNHNWPGWWSKIELFSPEMYEWLQGDQFIYLDLDTDVTGSLDSLVRDNFTMLSDFYRPQLPASGVMSWRSDNAPAEVYEAFCKAPDKHMKRYTTAARWGDQGFIRDHAHNIDRFEDGIIASYKVHGKPDWANVIAYHGKPKPWDL